jgi:hypothetical protein
MAHAGPFGTCESCRAANPLPRARASHTDRIVSGTHVHVRFPRQQYCTTTTQTPPPDGVPPTHTSSRCQRTLPSRMPRFTSITPRTRRVRLAGSSCVPDHTVCATLTGSAAPPSVPPLRTLASPLLSGGTCLLWNWVQTNPLCKRCLWALVNEQGNIPDGEIFAKRLTRGQSVHTRLMRRRPVCISIYIVQ